MTGREGERGGVPVRAVAMAALGWLGLAACLALVFLAMRAVMDVGGACADGGPYVSAQACPEGSVPALVLGIFLGIGFAVLASAGGVAIGGIWAATPVLAWSALFGSLGWNFLDYGLVSAPPETGLALGWVIPGVLFWVMAVVPLLAVASPGRLIRPGVPNRGATPPRSSGSPEPPPFTEGTQALLDRLERLADMRDRGLLDAGEYETAKAAIMAELEGRT